jgi:hypothetical protein
VPAIRPVWATAGAAVSSMAARARGRIRSIGFLGGAAPGGGVGVRGDGEGALGRRADDARRRPTYQYARLLLEGDDAESGAERVRVGAAADHAHCVQRIDPPPRRVALDQPLVARLLNQPSDAVEGPVPRALLPTVTPRRGTARG